MPSRDLILAACGLALLGAGHVSIGDRPGADPAAVLASLTQTRPVSIANPLDSRLRPDGVPVVVPEPRALDC